MTAMVFRWEGDVFMPLRRFAKACDAEFTIGELYRLEAVAERSAKSHSHYFACVADAWANLPDDQAAQFPTSEHLRKWALIKAGYRDERSIVCASKAEAQRVAAFIKPMDEYAVVVVREAVVLVLTAKSQSTKAMGGKDFQDSKTKVLEILSDLVGVTPKALEAAQ
jgi:hypothetical protein